jgi:simple sugar transport system permease protein
LRRAHGRPPPTEEDAEIARQPPQPVRRAPRPRRAALALLARPDIGAFIGAVAVYFAFGYFARDVDWLGDPAIAAGWTDQAAQYGIVAVPVALLMIGGEFDLSAGVMIGSSGLLLGYLTTHQDMNVWPAMAIVLLFGLAIGSSTASPS